MKCYEGENNLLFFCGDKEMLRITPEGFYIEGELIKDNKERIYEQMLEFLGYHLEGGER